MKKIIIDIDNTLWDFAPVLYERMSEASPDLPPSSEWREWDFWRSYLKPKTVYKIIDSIQMEQEIFQPFADAAEFLSGLKQKAFYIIIASHRRPAALDPTERWLRNHGLVYDEIHLSYDKTVLFDTCWGIVDDSPETLDLARGAGIVRAGLRSPWNDGQDHPLFDNLGQISEYLETQL
jgi:FMN phosphatase YigB (HAD superfamily)